MAGLPPGVTITPDQPRGLPAGVTITPDRPARGQERGLLEKIGLTASEFVKGIVEGTINIPKNYFEAAAARPPGATGVTEEMVQPAASAALLATTGKSPFASAGADTAALAGAGARTSEARAVGEAAVAEGVRPPGPWDAGGTALEGQVQGQRAVANAMPSASAPPPIAGAQPPPMPAEVAGALDRSLGPAEAGPIPRTPIPEPVGPARPSEITAKDRAEADALLAREGAPKEFKADLGKAGFSAQEQAAIAKNYLPPANFAPATRPAPADVPGAPAQATPLPPLPAGTPRASTTPSVKPAETPAVGLTPEVQAVIDTLSKALPEGVMNVLLRSGVRQAANAVAPGAGPLVSAAMKSAKIYRWMLGIGKAAGDRAKLAPFQRQIPTLSRDKSTRELLQKAVVAANASRPSSSGQRL